MRYISTILTGSFIATTICVLLLYFNNIELRTLSIPYFNTSLQAPHFLHTHNHSGFCAFDDLQNNLSVREKRLQNQLEQQLHNLLQRGYPSTNGRALYTIPVVVHVVHNNGTGNIPNTQVQDAIQHLNDAFANVGVYNPATGVDVEVQFCLAQRDPNGNTTNGITNTVSTLTSLNRNTQDLALKNLSRWNPLDYINIWVVDEIQGGVAGYAYFPSAHGGNLDGIVLEATYMGTNTDNSKVLVHEMGHYIGLYHTFQGGCANNDCLVDGDRVCDTPPDNTTARPPCASLQNSCMTDEDDLSTNNPFRPIANGGLGEQQDQKENYMDYSNLSCYDRFTQGQKVRAHFFLTGIRASLLASQGCVAPCTTPINVAFTASATTVVAGTNVNFNNTTTGATAHEWFNDGVSFATTTNSSFLFNTIGTFNVVLESTNGDPNCTQRDSITITVTCNAQASFTANTTQVSPGDAVVFNNTSTGATGYQWFVNNVLQGTNLNFNFTFPLVGTYDISLVATDGVCTDTSATSIITVTTTALAQTGLPIWPLAPYGNVSPSSVDWRNPTPVISSINAATTNGGQTGAAFNDCGQLAFYVLHTGSGNANNLYIYAADGTPLLTNTTANAPGLNAVKAGQEIQVIKVPQSNDEWYIIYKQWTTDVGAPISNGAYTPANWMYSRVQYTGGNTLTVLQRDIALADGAGVSHTYTDGAAVSRTAAGLSNQHYLYLCRRTPNVSNVSLDRFLITAANISWDANTGNVPATWWFLTIAGSPIELSPTEDKVAVVCRNQSVNFTDVVLFDANAFNNIAVQAISLGNLVLQPDGTAIDQSNVLNTSGAVDVIATNATYPLGFLRNMERKVNAIEFSPNGRFLYFTNGGYAQGGVTNVTYLGQIDLNATPLEVRLQVQTVPSGLNMTNGTGCPTSSCINSWTGITGIESCYDGNLYYTKRGVNTFFVIPNPNNFMPQNLVPSNIDLATAIEPNINFFAGTVFASPDQIDGFNYLSSQYNEVTLIVQQLDCNGVCDTNDYTVEIVDSSGAVVESFLIENCPDTITFCADTSLIYGLRDSSGISYPYAIYNGQTLYPAGDSLFDFSPTTGCNEICDNGIDDDGDGLIDCYDPDCCGHQNCTNVFYTACPTTPCTYPVIDTNITMQQRYQSTTDYMVFHTPVFGDIDLDGETEVVLLKYNTGNNAIDIVNGLSGAIETTIPTSTFGDNRISTIALGDIDVNDGGFSEIIVSRGDGFIQAFNHDGTSLWTSSSVIQHIPQPISSALPPNLVDFNNDGFPEVYAGYHILNGQTGVLMGSGASGRGVITLANQTVGMSQTVAIDVLPDNYCANCQGLELVAGNTVYSVNINTSLNTASLNAEVNTTGLDGFTAVADWDNDGDLDGIITTAINQTTSRLYVWDLQTTTILGSVDIPIGTATSGPQPSVIGVGRANIADLDGDGFVEATYCTTFKFVAIENNFTQKWSIPTTDGSGVTGGTVYDFNGDGTFEVVYRDSENLRILNGTTGTNVIIQPCRSGTTIEYPTIGDIDGNGTTEILTMCNTTQPTGITYTGKFTVFESLNTPWVPTRDVWNQYTYHYTNINDDLSIPIQQQNHQLVGDSSVLNNFLNQYSNPEFPAADATVNIDSIWCSGDSVTIMATICNNGNNTLPYQTPITIYDENPTTNASASPISAPHTIGQSILVDSCLVITIKAHQSALNYFIVVNDDASLAPIFSLTADFPVTSIPECDFTNNMANISFIAITPPLDLGPDTSLCENSVLTLNAGAGFYSYLWQNNSTDSILTADSSGLYWVETISACGDTLRDSIIINIDTLGLVTLVDTTLCHGDTLDLSLNNTYNYQWFPNLDISCNNCANPRFYPSVSRTYTLVTNNAIGCFSVDTFNISIDTCTVSTTIDTAICHGDFFAYQGNNLPPGTVDTFTYTSSSGIDSFVFVNVFGLDTFNIIIDTTLCFGDSLSFGGQQLFPNTSTVFNLQTTEGCDSIITVNVNALDTFNLIIDTTACAGSGITHNGQILLAGSSTTFNFQTINGCDSTVTVNVQSLDTFNIAIDTAICLGSSMTYNGQTLLPGSSTTFNFQTTNGCDSTVTVNVQSLDTFNMVIDTSVCLGGTIVYNGQTLLPGSSTTFNFQTINGCDSTVTLNVQGLDTFNIVIDTSICLGSTFAFGGQQLQTNTSTVFNLQTTNGCDSIITVNVGSLDTFNITIDTIICVGSSLVYNGQTLMAGTSTTFNLQTIAGCDSIVTVNVSTAPITFTTSNTMVSCNGGSDGTATINASGGVGGFTYAWNSSAQTSATATALSAGLHCVTLTDGNGCTVDTCIQVNEPAALGNISFSTTNVNCFGSSTGTATISLTGGTGAYSYNWSNGDNTATATGLDANTHSVTVTDANACTITANVVITQLPALQIALTTDSVQCKNGNDGSATTTVTGGTFPYTYQWDVAANNQVTATASNLTAGTYNVTVTDFNGCTIIGSATVFEPTAVLTAAIINQMDPSCNGGSNGSIEVDAQGATPNYTYQWSNGQNTSIATNVSAGLHTVTVTDANGCSISISGILGEPTAITLNPQVLSNYNGAAISCTGAADGSVGVAVAGGSGGYTFVWSPQGQNTANIAGLVAGTYCVTVTDIAGCSMDTCITIVDPVQLAATFTSVDVLCNGDANGQILVNATTGTGTLGLNGYEYRITGPGQTGNVFSNINAYNNLVAGAYTVFVRDGNNCEISLPISIGEPDSVLIDSVVITDALCNGTATGSATAHASGGVGGFTYIWSTSPVQTTQTATGLAAGVYSVTVSDANGCDRVDVFNVGEPTVLTGTVNADPIDCFGGTTSATALGSGGTPAGLTGYVYNWSNGTTSATTIGLAAGVHCVTITDDNACSYVECVTITQPSTALTATIAAQTDATCNGLATGTATAQGTGGTAPYTYLWDAAAGNQTTAMATGLGIGVYTVVVSDTNGCTAQTTVTISEPSPVLASITSTTGATCNGVGSGSATAAGTGGVGPYTYLWPDAQTGATATSLAGGTYVVTVSDANGCTATATAIITEPTAVLVTVVATTDVSCHGGNDGTASISMQGGTPTNGYTIQWSGAPGLNSPNATGLSAGIQTVTLIDANGCFDIDTFTINEPVDALSGYLTTADALCFGSATGELGAIITGGTAPYSYAWNSSPAQTTVVADSLVAGTYTVLVTDANGCTFSLTGVIGEPTELAITANVLQDVTCFGGSNGLASVVTTIGGVGPYSYVWTDPTGQTGLSASNLSAGVVSVIVTDANACTAMATVTLTEGSPITVTNTVTNISCNGLTDGSINITGSNKVLIAYNWSNGLVGNPVSGLGAGTYTVTVTDVGGCQDEFTYTITEPDPINLSIVQTSTILCHGAGNAAARVTGTGGTAPYTYNWSNGATTRTASNLAPGSYDVTVTDSRGCFEITSISIVQPDLLTITGSTSGTLCAGDQAGTLTAIGAGGTVVSGLLEYSIDGSTWQNGNIFSGLASGIYTLSVRDENGCTVDTMLVVEDADPFFISSMTGDTTIEYLDSMTIEVTLNDTAGVTFAWNQILGTMGLVTDSTYSFGITPEDAVQYQFTATNSNGCSVDSIVIIDVSKPRRANAPTGFTPNGDGVNDYFFIQGGDKVQEVTIFRIYDRWGTLVFEGNNLDINVAEQGWNGIYRGRPATSGTYVWYADVLFKDGENVQIKGSIILLR